MNPHSLGELSKKYLPEDTTTSESESRTPAFEAKEDSVVWGQEVIYEGKKQLQEVLPVFETAAISTSAAAYNAMLESGASLESLDNALKEIVNDYIKTATPDSTMLDGVKHVIMPLTPDEQLVLRSLTGNIAEKDFNLLAQATLDTFIELRRTPTLSIDILKAEVGKFLEAHGYSWLTIGTSTEDQNLSEPAKRTLNMYVENEIENRRQMFGFDQPTKENETMNLPEATSTGISDEAKQLHTDAIVPAILEAAEGHLQSVVPVETSQAITETIEELAGNITESDLQKAIENPSEDLKQALEEHRMAQQHLKMMNETRPGQSVQPLIKPNRKQRRAQEKANRRGKKQMVANMKKMMAREAAKLPQVDTAAGVVDILDPVIETPSL